MKNLSKAQIPILSLGSKYKNDLLIFIIKINKMKAYIPINLTVAEAIELKNQLSEYIEKAVKKEAQEYLIKHFLSLEGKFEPRLKIRKISNLEIEKLIQLVNDIIKIYVTGPVTGELYITGKDFSVLSGQIYTENSIITETQELFGKILRDDNYKVYDKLCEIVYHEK